MAKPHGNKGQPKPQPIARARSAALAPPPFFQNMGQPPPDVKIYKGNASAWMIPLPGTNPVPLTEITGCKWPVTEIGPTLFCNHEKKPDHQASYCATHAAMAKPRLTEATTK